MKFCHHLSLGQLNEKSGRKLLSIFPPTSRRFSLRNLSKISQDEAIHSFQKTHALAIRSPVRIVLESRRITRHALILKFQQICLNRLSHLSSMQMDRTENNLFVRKRSLSGIHIKTLSFKLDA
ncbi:hypothetical protein FOBRF1_011213 [Fusarium oxysporum]